MIRLPSIFKRIVNYIGLVLSLGLLSYLGYQFYLSDGYMYLQYFSFKQYLLAFISVFIYGLSVVALALSWRSLFKRKTHDNILLNAYFKTILWKYLPSNTLHFVGRHFYLAKEFKHKAILLGSVIEITLSILSALMLITILMIISGTSIVEDIYIDQSQLILGVITFLIIVTFVIHKKGVLSLKEFFITNGGYFLAQLLSSLSFAFLWFVFIENNANNIEYYLQIMMIYSIGWILGFLAIGAPAGIGVREVFYLILLQPIVESQGLLLAFLLLSRVVNILAEFILYLVSFYLNEEKLTG